MTQVQRGYFIDPLFADADELAKLGYVQGDGLWRDKNLRLVVPNVHGLRDIVMRELHDSPLSGHSGIERTLEAVHRNYDWPGVSVTVKQYVRSCDSCQRNKSSNQAPAGLLQPLPVPERPWQVVTMDMITCLPLTSRGHDTIVVFVDKFSKMVHFVPCKMGATSAIHMAQLFFDNIVRLHGVPRRLISDRDPRFTSDFWRQLLHLVGTTVALSSAFHPQTDGQTERTNRTLEEVLRHFVSPTHDNWDELLSLAEFSINNAFNITTGSTPFRLNYGFDPLVPLTLLSEQRPDLKIKEATEKLPAVA